MSSNEHPPTTDAPARTGRRYSSVETMLQGESAAKETLTRFTELTDATRVTRVLAQIRAAHGLTQKEMGEQIGLTQGAISKLEAGRDEDLKLSEICAYSKVLNERIGVVFGRPLHHVEAITAYLNLMRFHMLELAKIASNDAEMDNRMNKFFGDALFSMMELMSSVCERLPNGIKGCGFTKEVIYQTPSTSASDVGNVERPISTKRQREVVEA